MLIELHVIQSFAPSNLNRDDTGAPKDCLFGGVRRARVSSQCIKRAVRQHFGHAELLDSGELGKRTKLVCEEIARRLVEKKKGDIETAQKVAAVAVEAVGLKVASDGETQYLVFWGPDEIGALTALCENNWNELAALSAPADGEETKRGKAKKKTLAKGVTDEFKELAKKVLTVPKASDVALFGRMLADIPEKNVYAASQVAHALSTHKVEMEMDFYTAVDDLQKIESEEGAGAGMMGTVSFNAACFYRYANVHYDELVRNLKDDVDLARKTVGAFIQASLEAVPSGKQNSFAAFNPPSFAMTLVREKGQPMSLANAFERPVRGADGFVGPSVSALDEYWGRVAKVFGADDGGGIFFLNVGGYEAPEIAGAGQAAATAAELVEKTLAALS
jgi:CRISPR system Cascade subunit CasC